MADDITRAFGTPLHERIEAALGHAIAHDQMRNALWPFQPFAMSTGELLREAARVAELEAEVQRLRADAERYRHLRDHASWEDAVDLVQNMPGEMDQEVDRAMQRHRRASERKEG